MSAWRRLATQASFRRLALHLGMVLAISYSGACVPADGEASFDAAPAQDAASSPHPIGALGPGLSTLVGADQAGFIDGSRELSLFDNPVNVLISVDGNILVADFNNGAVREVSPSGLTRTVVKQAGFSRPFGMTLTPTGELYVQTDRNSSGADTGALWRVAPDTGVAELVRDEVGRARGLGSLSDGRLVLANKFAHTLRIYDPEKDLMSPLAGLTDSPGLADGTGSAARFNEPLDIVIDDGDVIFVADSGNNVIRQVSLAGVVTTVAGTGVQFSLDGPALAASFDTPAGLALGSEGRLFVSEFQSGLIRELRDGFVSTVAGSTQGFADNANPLLGRLYVCEGIASTASYLYIADGNGGTEQNYHRVRRVDIPD